AGGLIDNSSLLYGGGNLQLLSAALVNRYGNILAGNSLWIQRDAAGAASDSVLNSSGTIETQRGDIRINTGTLTNQREGLTVTESSRTAAEVPSWAGGPIAHIPMSLFGYDEYGLYFEFEPASDQLPWIGYYTTNKSVEIKKVSIKNSNVTVSAQGGISQINSANDLIVSASDVINNASSLTAQRNITLGGDRLQNSSYQAGSTNQYLVYESTEFEMPEPGSTYYNRETQFNGSYVSGYNSGQSVGGINQHNSTINVRDYLIYKLKNEPVYEEVVGETYAATIQAGGAITANFSQNISNTSLQPGSGGFIPSIATPTLTGVSAPTPVGAQADRGLGGASGNVTTTALGGAGSVALAGQAGSLNAGYGAVTRDTPTPAGSPL
ncbi:hemolysin BL-binding protein, partial [Dickeya fangzhongdai]